MSEVPEAIQRELDSVYVASDAERERFAEDGFIKLKGFYSPELLAFFDPIVTERTLELNPLKGTKMEDRSTYDRAFVQVGNLWTKDETVKAFAFSRRAASAAATLMGVDGVRMWHDQSLYKEAKGGFTPWHVDQYYWPMGSGKSATAWVPFTAVPIESGPLCFGRGSHVKFIARDIPISDESEQRIRDAVKAHGVVEVFEPYALGEVSFHYGWTLHRAGGNSTDRSRRVFTTIYMDQDMRLIEPRNENHIADAAAWCPGVEVGGVIDSPLNPVLWSAGG